jgi:hypothetical protein
MRSPGSSTPETIDERMASAITSLRADRPGRGSFAAAVLTDVRGATAEMVPIGGRQHRDVCAGRDAFVAAV